MKTKVSRGEVWNITLDPTKGSEQAGFRPCVIVSPDSMNDQLETIIVVPLTTKLKNWPTRVETSFQGKNGQAMCEQIRTVSKRRLRERIDTLRITEVVQIKLILKQMLVE